tara:strand:+ start:257 stop:397 length:141 start_codon:yes stop_codon:yes gene_type:complete
MSKKLYEHIISTNYANINTKIKKATKKAAPRKVSTGNNSPDTQRNS